MKVSLVFAIFAAIVAMVASQNIFNVNYRIANSRGATGYNQYGQKPSVDPSAYYTGANRAKIARHLAQYNF